MTVITERRERQLARNRLQIVNPQLLQLCFTEAIEMVDVQIFVTFALGMPQHRNFKALQLFERNAANSPLSLELLSCFVRPVFTA